MSSPRGLMPLALTASTLILILCAAAWGALGVISLADTEDLSPAAQRYLCMLLVTLTTCSVGINLTARLARTIREASASDEPGIGGYADGYADGLAARPGAPRLVPTRR